MADISRDTCIAGRRASRITESGRSRNTNASTFFGSTGLAPVVVYGAWRWLLVAKMRSWPKASGRIERLDEVKRLHTQEGITAPYFVPNLEVVYQVGEVVYRTTRFSIHNFTIGFPGEARELLNNADVGSAIEVYYDPTAPQRSIARLPSQDGALVALFLGCIVAAITALVATS